MASPKKYAGPCPDHTQHVHDCKHCKALRERERFKSIARQSDAPIYQGLHWRAPQL